MVPECERLANNLTLVKTKIQAACSRASRSPDDVTLLAVTKTVSVEVVASLVDLGLTRFGENRAQVGAEKVAVLDKAEVEWHFIGHLQRNKVKHVLPGFRVFHSIDSLRLAKTLAEEAVKKKCEIEVFVEVNVSGEASKHGVAPDDAFALAEYLASQSGVSLRGLMTMAPICSDVEQTRPVFRRLRELRDSIIARTGIALPDLSMGMSNDFEIAIEEGATVIRLGSVLFQ